MNLDGKGGLYTFWCKQRGMLRTLGVAGVGMALLGTLSSTMAFMSPAMAGFRSLQLAQTTQRQCRGPACAPLRRSVLPLKAMMDPATVRGPQHHNRRAPLACLFLHVRPLCRRCQLRCLRMPHAVGSSCFRGAGSSSGLALGSGAPCCHLPGTSCHPSHADSSILLCVNVARVICVLRWLFGQLVVDMLVRLCRTIFVRPSCRIVAAKLQ